MYYLEENDIDLTTKTLNLKDPTLQDLKNNGCKIIIIMTKADWCGHCNNTSPAFENASETINNNEIIFCYADITGERQSEKNLKDKVGKFFKEFKGFPNITCFSLENGKEKQKYNGNRSSETIKEYALSQL
jgi:thiol-disulfide isomerase/thioredoxin